MTFAAQLRAASGSMTARQIAHATGYSKRTVEGWRRGKAPLPQHQAEILSNITLSARPNTSVTNSHTEKL